MPPPGFQQNRQSLKIIQVFSHRPYLNAGLGLLLVLILFWNFRPQEHLSFPHEEIPHEEIALPTNALPEPLPSSPVLPITTPPEPWSQRAAQVKSAFVHAYHGYEQYAAPHDELTPLSSSTSDGFNGWGVSIVDSLDTMLLMNLNEEYSRALAQVSGMNFTLAPPQFAPFFETVIRYLGGFLSAYALSKDPVLLARAEDLAFKLDPVFDKYKGVFPVYGVNTQSGDVIGSESGGLAEIASLQVEYLYLAKATGKKRYFDRATTVMNTLAGADLHKTGGMLPTKWSLNSGVPYDTHVSLGGNADSAHEYLLKQYLLTGKTDKKSLEMYIRTTTHILTTLLYVSPTRRMLYVTDTSGATTEHGARPTHKMEHLACFLPGLLALGAHTLPLDNATALGLDLRELGTGMGWAERGYAALARQPSLKEIHLWAAAGLAETCYMLYADQPTGLGPNEVVFKAKDGNWSEGGGQRWIDEVETWRAGTAGSGTWKGRRLPPGVGEDTEPWVSAEHKTDRVRDYAVKMPQYFLRPETVESLYLMWRITGESKWRDMGWQIFEAIERETRTPVGYASLGTVEFVPAHKIDAMPSYFLAETLKYLYLLFINDDPLPLDAWVFSTEAHPLPVFQWSEEEKDRFGIL